MPLARSSVCHAVVSAWIMASIALAAAGLAHAATGQWSSTGPPAASIRAVATDRLSLGTVYAGANGPGMFKTTNGGESWTAINIGLTNTQIRAVAVDPLTPSTVYVGTAGGGVFKSIDGGASWVPASIGLTNSLINTLAIDPQTPATLYAGTSGGGVFRSVNGGTSWTPANLGLTNLLINTLAIDPSTPSTLYAGTNGGFAFKSVNGGASWVSASFGLLDPLVNALAIDPQTPATVYAGTAAGGVFKSVNGGGVWIPFSNGLTNTLVTALLLDPQNPTTVYAGTTGGGVFRSVNGGGSWIPFNSGLTNTLVTALATSLFATCLHAGTSNGVFDFTFQSNTCGSVPSPLVAAVLPGSRSVQTGAAATAFATIINSASTAVTGCSIAPLISVPATFLYQATDPSTNHLIGTANTPVTIPAGGLGTFLIAFNPTAPFSPTDIFLRFSCANAPPAPAIHGVNDLLLGASATAVPDIVALAATLNNDGIVNIPGAAGTGAFAVATVNVGASGQITASADVGSAATPVVITICETNPTTGGCLAAPATSVTRVIGAGQTPTYGLFVTGHGVVLFDPGVNRVFVRFTDSAAIIRGSTSVATRTQ